MKPLQTVLRFLSVTLVTLTFAFDSPAFAADFPFSDVPTSDPIYQDLKKLYERGVVDAPSDGKFRPEALMDRDEFVSIAVGVGCRKCLTPTIDDVLRYREIPFLDFSAKSPYFYCVSYAKERNIVNGYSIPGATSYTCQNDKTWNGVPFCAQNRTSRIEAAAMLLRQAGLWSDELNAAPFERKRTFKDVADYWYGYAQKGTDVGILVPDSDGTLRPDEYVTKREFVRMAAIVYSLNMCEAKGMSGNSSSSSLDSKDALSSEIRVLDSATTCSPAAQPSKFAKAATEYNFYGLPSIEGATYSWEFVPADGSGSSVRAEGQCLPKESLPAGRWIAKLTVTDSSGRSSTSYAEVPFWPASKVPLSASAWAEPLSFPAGVPTVFGAMVSGGVGPYLYRWDLGDGTVTSLSDPKHAYQSEGYYPATLVVTDSEGNRAIAKVVVEVSENADLDADGVLNAGDSCPRVYGPKSNAGCPSVTEYASTASPTSDGVFGNLASLTVEGVGGLCAYSYAAQKGAVFGKASCSACPCAYEVDFLAQARRCDLFFPAILSPDKKNVYSRGAIFELR